MEQSINERDRGLADFMMLLAVVGVDASIRCNEPCAMERVLPVHVASGALTRYLS